MVSGVDSSPQVWTKKAMKIGPNPKDRVPPRLKRDMERPIWGPEYWETMPAAGGWNMETPMDPTETKRSKTV
jgi:hypothetical protein